jgi:hypothetical protein
MKLSEEDLRKEFVSLSFSLYFFRYSITNRKGQRRVIQDKFEKYRVRQ